VGAPERGTMHYQLTLWRSWAAGENRRRRGAGRIGRLRGQAGRYVVALVALDRLKNDVPVPMPAARHARSNSSMLSRTVIVTITLSGTLKST
jgi:hypothetical protein